MINVAEIEKEIETLKKELKNKGLYSDKIDRLINTIREWFPKNSEIVIRNTLWLMAKENKNPDAFIDDLLESEEQ